MADGGPSRKTPTAAGAALEVEIVRHHGGWTRAQVTDALLRRAARAALRAAPPLPGDVYRVTVVLTRDVEMRDLNRVWRGKDEATNVLSFPADRVRDQDFLGDLVLAYDTTRKEADAQGIPLADHVRHLVVHGMLHLLGFDHVDDEQAERMETIERKALASIGVADPYADADEIRHAGLSP